MQCVQCVQHRRPEPGRAAGFGPPRCRRRCRRPMILWYCTVHATYHSTYADLPRAYIPCLTYLRYLPLHTTCRTRCRCRAAPCRATPPRRDGDGHNVCHARASGLVGLRASPLTGWRPPLSNPGPGTSSGRVVGTTNIIITSVSVQRPGGWRACSAHAVKHTHVHVQAFCILSHRLGAVAGCLR